MREEEQQQQSLRVYFINETLDSKRERTLRFMTSFLKYSCQLTFIFVRRSTRKEGRGQFGERCLECFFSLHSLPRERLYFSLNTSQSQSMNFSRASVIIPIVDNYTAAKDTRLFSVTSNERVSALFLLFATNTIPTNVLTICSWLRFSIRRVGKTTECVLARRKP